METYAERDQKLKRLRDEAVDASKEVKQEARIKTVWEYLEEVKQLQELEIQAELLRKKLKMKETRFPDLKNLRGNVDHLTEDRFWEVEIDSKKRIVPGKSLEEATGRYKKKLEQDEKNAKAQKEKAKTAD